MDAESPIRFSGTMEPADAAEAARLELRPRAATAIALAALGLGLGYFYVVAPLVAGESVSRVATPIAIAVWFVLFFAFGVPWIAKQRMQTNRIAKEPVEGAVSGSGLEIASTYGRSSIPWSALHGGKASAKLALVYTSEGQYFLLPRRFFRDDAAWLEFLALLRARVPERPRANGLGVTLRTLILWVGIFVVVILIWNALQESR